MVVTLIKFLIIMKMNVDWMRIYKRANQPLWLGSKPVSWDWKTKTVELVNSCRTLY